MSKNLYIERIDRLIEPAKTTAKKQIEEANKIGIYVAVVATERTIAEQNSLYAIGRTKRGNIVTNARGGDSIHNYRLAWDLCPIVDNKLTWNRIDLFNKLGEIGKKLGAVWGGDFKTIIDKAHFQATGGFSLKQLKAGMLPDQPSHSTVKYRFQHRGKPDQIFDFANKVKLTFGEKAIPKVENLPTMHVVNGLIECTVAIRYEKALVEAIKAWRGEIIGHSYS